MSTTCAVPTNVVCAEPDLVKVADEPDLQDLRRVIDGSLLLLIWPAFYSPEDAQKMSSRLLDAQWITYDPSTGAGDIMTMYDTLFGCLGGRECNAYFEQAAHNMRRLDRILRPYANPARVMVEEIRRIWPAGADLLKIGGRTCYVGLPRCFQNGGGAHLHTDRADWDYVAVETAAIRVQLGWNHYLEMSSEGGELELWDGVVERGEYDHKRDPLVSYALRREMFGDPLVVYRPQAGDVAIFGAHRPHAVRASWGTGSRVTVSGFADFVSADSPLLFHS
jgi:hypothetical protein